MSIKAVSWALDQDVSDAYAKLVLIGMCDSHNGETSLCHPNKSTLARKASCSIGTVTRKIKWLSDNGWINISKRFDKSGRQTSNSYILLMDNIPNGEGITETMGGIYSDTGEGITEEGGEGIYCDTPNRTGRRNGKKEREYKIIIKETPFVILSSVLSEEIAKEVISHRKALRKPLGNLAAKRLANKFAECPDPDEAASVMVENGWQGFNQEWLDKTIRRQGDQKPKSVAAVAMERAMKRNV